MGQCLGRSPHVYLKSQEITVRPKDRNTTPVNAIGLNDYLLQSCSLLREPMRPTPWLLSGHLQTLYTVLHSDTSLEKIFKYEREIVNMPDGGQVALDWTVKVEAPIQSSASESDGEIILVLLHGLTGGSQELYIRSVIGKTCSAFRSLVVHGRGCNGSPVVTPQLYSGRYTNDVRFIMHYLSQTKHPKATFILIGFSLGSNILVNYLAEEGHAATERWRIRAAISVGNPYDFILTNRYLHDRWFYRVTYGKTLGRNLVRLFQQYAPLFEKQQDVDRSSVLQSKTSTEYDERFTRRMFGYMSVDEYMRDAGCSQRLKAVRVPLICLSAIDDPVAPATAIPFGECRVQPWVSLITTEHGGHLGWFEGWLKPEQWSSKLVHQLCVSLSQLEVGVEAPESLYMDEKASLYTKLHQPIQFQVDS